VHFYPAGWFSFIIGSANCAPPIVDAKAVVGARSTCFGDGGSMRTLNTRLLFAIGVAVVFGNLARCDSQEYRVGAGRVEITPAYPVRLNGFGSRRDEASGVSQRLWAKALAISSAGQPPVVIFAIDNLGIREAMVDEVARALNDRFQIPRENVALTFTHTHCAPKVNGACDTIFSTDIPPDHQGHIDQYTSELPGLLIQAATQAVESLRPAELEWAVGNVGFAENRRTPGGPVDHDLPVLFARDESGKLIAVYTTYACHCVTLSFNQYSGDWAGYAQELIETSQPGTVAMVSIGCGSDANPAGGVTGDNLAAAAEQGQQIAREVERLVSLPKRTVRGQIDARLSHVPVPLAPLPTLEQLEEVAAQGGSPGYNATWQLNRLKRGEALVAELNYPLQTITFGDSLHLVFLAGEVCVDYALRLKRELRRDRVWIHGYSNDFCAYIPSERLLAEGGYGGGGEIPYFALPGPLAAGLEDRLISAVIGQTPESFRAEPGTPDVPPKDPLESLACIYTHPGLTVQLVAAEPLVADPVAIDFGIDGSLWVAQMPDYGRGVDEEFPPQGEIRLLRDANGDGDFDSAASFLSGLRFPTDVKIWRDGILVCDAPDVIFAADRDGDGRAEVRETVLTGFATHNPHARVNSLRIGLDGWVYGSGGLFGGQVRNRAGITVDVGHRDFRFRPDDGTVEGASGQSQQGRTRDDFDNWFGCTNGKLLLHFPLDEQYIMRNERLLPPATIVDVPSARHGQQLFPPGNLVLFKLSGAPGRPTSACGVDIYRDRVIGERYYGNAFVCEPVHQLVHRMVLTADGTTFVGDRDTNEADSEFLTSTDQWFRPVQARMGPDGCLYVVDMYRYVIEHSQWIPPESLRELDVMAGHSLGRIYRIAPSEQSGLRLPDLSGLDDVQLAGMLASENGVLRDIVGQLIVWQEPVSSAAVDEIRRIAATATSAGTAVHAAALLKLLGKLEAPDVSRLLNGEDPEARRAGLRLSQGLQDRLESRILDQLRCDSAKIRTQAAFELCHIGSLAAHRQLASHLMSSPPNSLELFAGLSSVTAENAIPVWRETLSQADRADYHDRLGSLMEIVAGRCDAKSRREVWQLAKARCDEWNDPFLKYAVFADWLTQMADIEPASIQPGEKELADQYLAHVRTAVAAGDLPEESLLHAIRFLSVVVGPVGRACAIDAQPRDTELLFQCLGPLAGPDVHSAAAEAIFGWNDAAGTTRLLDLWHELTPRLRAGVVDQILARETCIGLLLDSIVNGQIRASELDAAARERLLNSENEAIRAKSREAFGFAFHSDRNGLIEEWRPALSLAGEFEQGRRVFVKNCAACHVLDGVGHEVGPDLAALSNRTPAAILTAVLDPGRDVESRYVQYSAVTTDGLTYAGLLAGETAASISLKEREGREHVILRKDLDGFRALKKSMMPEGVENDMTQQDLADLMAYIEPPRTPRRQFPGNAPQIVSRDNQGVFRCFASNAGIYGEAIVFEPAFQNIGYWSGARDHVVWTLDSPDQRPCDVYLDYACDDGSAGSECLISGPTGDIRYRVQGTGGWSEYRWTKAGAVDLPAGQCRLVIGLAKPTPVAALMDLRTVVLVPAGEAWTPGPANN
jgi:putative membrane-bound dehydrogenase-like protein